DVIVSSGSRGDGRPDAAGSDATARWRSRSAIGTTNAPTRGISDATWESGAPCRVVWDTTAQLTRCTSFVFSVRHGPVALKGRALDSRGPPQLDSCDSLRQVGDYRRRNDAGAPPAPRSRGMPHQGEERADPKYKKPATPSTMDIDNASG